MANDFELQEELQALQDVSSYNIPNEHDPATDDIERLLEAAVEAVAESTDNILEAEILDVYRSILKFSDAVSGNVMSKLLDSITSGLQAQLEATIRDQDDQQSYASHRTAFEVYAFLLQWFVSAAEKVKASEEEGEAAPAPAPKARRGRGGKAAASGRSTRAALSGKKSEWTWNDQIPSTLGLIAKVLKQVNTQRIWQTTHDKARFIDCITKPAYHITENEQYMKTQLIRNHVYKVIALAVKHHNHVRAAQTNIIQSLQFYEHLAEPMAECLHVLREEFDFAQLGDEILREIAGISFSGQDTKGPRVFSKFLIRFADLAPRAVLKQLSLLLAHLDSESYPMRVALVEVIGSIIRDLAGTLSTNNGGGEPEANNNADQTQTLKQLTNLFDLLIERMLDVSSYVRTKVLSVFARIADLDAKFPKQRLHIADAAASALDDKASTVRKNAVVLLVRLILTHPFVSHGGVLTLKTWEEEYEVVKAELAQLEEKFGNAVEVNDVEEQEDEQEDAEDAEDGDTDQAEEDDEGTEGDSRKKRSRKSKARREDDMEVDEDGSQGADQEDEPMFADDDEERPKKSKKPKKLARRKSELQITVLSSEEDAIAALDGNKLLQMKLKKKYYVEALTFIRIIEKAVEPIRKLLGSVNKAEVLEAMEFFRVAHEYQFTSAKDGLRQMLHLIWSKDNSTTSEDGKELKGIRSRLLECYRSIYLDPIEGLDPKAQVNRIARNLIELTYEATLAHLISLEEMMRVTMDENHIHNDVIAKLWQVYGSTKPLPKAQRRGAIIIIGMLALARRSVVTNKIDTLLKVGLGSFGRNDLTLARYTCVALQRLNGSAKKVKGSLLDKTLRMEMDNAIFRKLQEAIEAPCRSKEWFGFAEQAINTIYALGDHPDQLCSDLIKKLTIRAFTRRGAAPASQSTEHSESKQHEASDDDDKMDEDPQTQASNEDPGEPSSQATPSAASQSKDVGDAFELAKLLFVVGHVAIKHIVFLELVEREWKRQKDEKQAAEKAASGRADGQRGGSKDVEELDQVAGNAEDEIGDRIAAVREHELLYGPDSLLAVYGDMLVHICGSPHKFKNQTLRATATLAFSKFLCVSSQFCDKNHRLLFKILETSKDAEVRSNVVIALGDVAVSFSSIIDENSNELYKGLTDTNLAVKKNTLMVLTHLILNGMIKVKGQLGEMAKCLEADDERIADLARLFFTELSTKDNAIYNNLPDVISHLSSGDHAVEELVFQSTLKYIFTFIEKEKQAESIVEKLCQRFRLTEDPRQWRDIAFCLSLLPFKSERSVKKLIEGLPFYRDKLHEEGVYARFSEILQKARSNKSANKPDTELNEFEQILDKHKQQGEEDQALEKRVETKKAAAKKRATRKARGKKTQVQLGSDDE
ncbi:hypothetical protein HGRIS_000767 [Hohenbuehelia grisea]|uniref:Condensin complex subunit 1 n=1 Tax=Hohenbuehelia grisea TaxID=104357 RepID=A0ABR3IPN8_9AGAR